VLRAGSVLGLPVACADQQCRRPNTIDFLSARTLETAEYPSHAGEIALNLTRANPSSPFSLLSLHASVARQHNVNCDIPVSRQPSIGAGVTLASKPGLLVPQALRVALRSEGIQPGGSVPPRWWTPDMTAGGRVSEKISHGGNGRSDFPERQDRKKTQRSDCSRRVLIIQTNRVLPSFVRRFWPGTCELLPTGSTQTETGRTVMHFPGYRVQSAWTLRTGPALILAAWKRLNQSLPRRRLRPYISGPITPLGPP